MENQDPMNQLATLPEPDFLHAGKLSDPLGSNTSYRASTVVRLIEQKTQSQRDELLKARQVLGAEIITLKHENARLRLLIQRCAKYPHAAASSSSMLRADVMREAGPPEDWRA